MSRQWVAKETFQDQVSASLYEAGGIYIDEGVHGPSYGSGGQRDYRPGEHETACPGCGQRFAAARDFDAEACRDLHLEGDDDIPLICRNR